MKIKKYTDGAWTDLDKPVKKFDEYTDTATALPLTIQTSATDAVDNYQVYGASGGAGVETENLVESIEQGTWSTTGFVKTDSDTRCRIGNIIDVIAEQSYTIHCKTTGSTQGMVNIQYKNDSGTSIGESGWQNFGTSGNYTATIPSGATKITIILTISPGNVNCSPLDFPNIMLVPGSTAPTSYIPHGYKIPILNTSGVTENLVEDFLYGYSVSDQGVVESNQYRFLSLAQIEEDKRYYVKCNILSGGNMLVAFFNQKPSLGSITYNQSRASVPAPEAIITAPINGWIAFWNVAGREDISMCIEGSTPPDHYIPHRYESNYDLFIGDSKLLADEYVDYGEQKIYKDISGVLTPTDPPAPLPAIQTYKGENSIDVDTTVQPEKVAVKYEGWKQAGDGEVEKYQNGEWSDNNGT